MHSDGTSEMNNVKTISTDNFKALCSTSAPFVIDVRTSAEFSGVHVDGAVLFPLQELKAETIGEAIETAGKAGEPVYILCKGGKRAEMAAKHLSPSFKCDLIVVEGGTDACVAAEMPVNKG
jgi:rhodanese-related sulfurtransferase